MGYIVKEVHGTGKFLECIMFNGCGAGGAAWLRGPQSSQSIPKAQSEYSRAGPPSSQLPSEPYLHVLLVQVCPAA